MPLDLKGVDVAGLNSLFPQKPKRNPITAGLSAGVDQLQGLGYNALAAGADALGLQRGRDWLLDRAALNEDEAYANGRPDLEMVEDQDLGSAIPFAAYQIAKQVPQIAGALGLGAVAPQVAIPAGLSRLGAVLPRAVGGGGAGAATNFAARRAAVESGNRFAANLTGGMALGTGLGAGALYGESVEAGDPSPYAALAAAPFYGLAEGVPTAVLGGTLARGAFRGNMAARMAQAGGVNALGGATSELAQNEMEMAFNPTLSPEEIASRRLNAAVVGGLAEGTIGSLGGIRRPAAPRSLLPDANPGLDDTPPPPAAPPLQLGFSGYDTGVGPLVTFPDGSTMTRAEYEQRIANMPSGPAQLEAYQPDRPYQYEGALDFTPSELPMLQGPYQPNLQLPLVPGQVDLFDPFMDGAGSDRAAESAALRSRLAWGFSAAGRAAYRAGDRTSNSPLRSAQAPLDETQVEGDPAPTEEMGALFEAYPDALVRTEYGLPQITAALRNANGGRYNAQLQRFIPEFSRAIEQGPAAVDALIARYDNAKSTLAPEVFETAAQMAQDFQSRMTNAYAAAGVRRAQPGVIVGTPPSAEASADAVYDTQERIRTDEAAARQSQQLTGAIADTDARALGAQEQRTTAARRQVLDSALEGAQNAGNARNRFIKSLRKAGFRDTIVRPEEQAVITRYFDLAQTLPAEEQVTDNTEMESMVPERGAAPPAPPAKKGTKPERVNENRSFQLTSPPATEADLAALEKAQAKRDRKAAAQATEEPPPVAEGTTGGKQGILFTKQGKPAAAADQERTPPPPRKSRVKVKVGEQEAELEVDDAPAKIEALKKDIDKYERFVACLRKK